ncbi:MAG: preprotein translocase subunit SecG [Cyclobacteriaceae bacterium]|nr:preprotein translocase subunit SecG [Cyclobacteriaceae bacterium HetDA_MAG_MS6]
MYAILVSVIILIAVLLILVVLAQNPKGGGLSSQFGGSGAAQVMGVKKTGDLLERLTWGFAISILALTLSTKLFIEDTVDVIESPNIENAQGQQSGAGLPALQQSPDDNSTAPIQDLGLTDSTN